MKTVFRTAAIAALIITASCGKDTADAIADIFEETEQIESTVLDIEVVSTNVLINGGTKMEGVPPTPNGAISLDLSNAGKAAFLGEGFDVSLNSDADITGAYIQFKSKDGNVSDSYYDVNLEINGSSQEDKSSKKGRAKNKGKESLTLKNGDTSLDVDFNTNIKPGEFCYVLCVYDGAGNISDPQEVCLTVQSWGGSSALVGFWKLTKDDYTQDGVTVMADLGEEVCNFYSDWNCEGGGTFQLGQCDTTDVHEIKINSDGTYDFELRTSGRYVDSGASEENCEQVYKETDFYYKSSGKWAYISDEDKLALLEYTYEEGDQDESYSGTNEIGQAYSLYNDKIQLDGNTFIMSDITDNEDDGIVDRVDNYYFEKQ